MLKWKKKMKTLLNFLCLFCFAWLQSVHQQVFGFHVQYWREVNLKWIILHWCVWRAISLALVVSIHYIKWKQTNDWHIWVHLRRHTNVYTVYDQIIPTGSIQTYYNTVFLYVSVHCNNAAVGWITACFSWFTSRISSFSVKETEIVLQKASHITPSFVLLLTLTN